jgi:hypothetical protein
MFETTRDFFYDAYNRKLEDTRMLDMVLTITGTDDLMPIGQLMHNFHKLTPRQRNYICCVLLERDQDPFGWEQEWSKLESEAFE